MTTHTRLEDTNLAALISSKICHDLAGQIGAINNGLELLEEENDEDTRYYAFELIQNSARAAWAQLDFHRLAFGASSSLGAVVPLGHVEQVARRWHTAIISGRSLEDVRRLAGIEGLVVIEGDEIQDQMFQGGLFRTQQRFAGAGTFLAM